MTTTERVLVPYQLPDGRMVQVDDSAAKGALVIDFTLADGQIVKAWRVVPTESESVVRYEITLTLTRPVRYDNDAPLAEQEEWAVSRDAKRELEREVFRAMRKLDGDCDCEVMSAAIVTE